MTAATSKYSLKATASGDWRPDALRERKRSGVTGWPEKSERTSKTSCPLTPSSPITGDRTSANDSPKKRQKVQVFVDGAFCPQCVRMEACRRRPLPREFCGAAERRVLAEHGRDARRTRCAELPLPWRRIPPKMTPVPPHVIIQGAAPCGAGLSTGVPWRSGDVSGCRSVARRRHS